MSGKSQAHNFAGRQLTDEQVESVLAIDRIKAWGWVILLAFIGMCLFVLALVPLARTIRGTHTDLKIQISIAFNIALGLTAAGGIAGCIGLNRARRHHRTRARELEKRLIEAKDLPEPSPKKGTT